MTELKLRLAAPSTIGITYESFRVIAEGSAGVGENESREDEGKALADLFFERLPGGTIHAMIERFRSRYAELGDPGLNPFLQKETDQ